MNSFQGISVGRPIASSLKKFAATVPMALPRWRGCGGGDVAYLPHSAGRRRQA